MRTSDSSGTCRPCGYALRLAAGAGAALALAACSGDGGGASASASGAARAEGQATAAFTIVAENLRWDLDRVVIPVGREVTATIENRDDRVGHNFHVLSSGDPVTAIEKGPVTQTLRFTIDEPGEYDFRCDPHPVMRGVVVAV